jgi:uracil phosphoribosyltransferase
MNAINSDMLNLLKHPLITHKLTQLRRKETETKEFRETLEEIAGLMAYEITRDLPLKNITVETPMGTCDTQELARDVVLIPVLRAGLGMVNGISNLIPSARIGHIGIYRDHETLEPNAYYSKFPDNLADAVVMILDPMLATGGSVDIGYIVPGLGDAGDRLFGTK